MQSISTISKGDLVFYRRLRRNLVFSEVLAYFASMAACHGLTKRQLGKRIGKDAAQITRWFSEPSNLCLDTVSDLLTGMEAEMEFRVVPAGEQYAADDLMKEFADWAAEPTFPIGRHPESVTQTSETATSMWTDLPRDKVYGEQATG